MHAWRDQKGLPVAFIYKYRTEPFDFDKREPPFFTPEFTQKLNELAGTKSAKIDEWLGREFIDMDFEEASVEKCYALCEAAIRLGAGVRPHNMLVQYNIKPPDLPPGEKLTPEKVELVVIKEMRKHVEDFRKLGTELYGILDLSLPTTNARYPSAWITPQARAFIKEAIQNRWLTEDERDEIYEKAQLEYDKEERAASSPAQVAPPFLSPGLEKERQDLEAEKHKIEMATKELAEMKRKFEERERKFEAKNLKDQAHKNEDKMEEDASQQCLVCLDAEANTTVSPCMHCCVCEPCSEKLRASPLNSAAIRCMQCQSPIDAIFGPKYTHSLTKSDV